MSPVPRKNESPEAQNQTSCIIRSAAGFHRGPTAPWEAWAPEDPGGGNLAAEARMLLVTGPVTRNMELALRKTYDAAPEPKLVVAVGACGISGGIFGTNYATRGGVDQVIPVDVYIPGCPPRPEALLHGILLAVGRLARRP